MPDIHNNDLSAQNICADLDLKIRQADDDLTRAQNDYDKFEFDSGDWMRGALPGTKKLGAGGAALVWTFLFGGMPIAAGATLLATIMGIGGNIYFEGTEGYRKLKKADHVRSAETGEIEALQAAHKAIIAFQADGCMETLSVKEAEALQKKLDDIEARLGELGVPVPEGGFALTNEQKLAFRQAYHMAREAVAPYVNEAGQMTKEGLERLQSIDRENVAAGAGGAAAAVWSALRFLTPANPLLPTAWQTLVAPAGSMFRQRF